MWEVLTGVFLGSVVSGFVPFVNAELLVVAAAAAVSPSAVPLVVIACTVGQMISKTGLFLIAARVPARLPERARTRMEKASSAIATRHGALAPFIFASAAIGFPPFYGVSLALGSLRMRIGTFLVAGTLGRGLRFGLLAWGASQWGERLLGFFGIGGS